MHWTFSIGTLILLLLPVAAGCAVGELTDSEVNVDFVIAVDNSVQLVDEEAYDLVFTSASVVTFPVVIGRLCPDQDDGFDSSLDGQRSLSTYRIPYDECFEERLLSVFLAPGGSEDSAARELACGSFASSPTDDFGSYNGDSSTAVAEAEFSRELVSRELDCERSPYVVPILLQAPSLQSEAEGRLLGEEL